MGLGMKERAKNARLVSVCLQLRQYLVAIATSLTNWKIRYTDPSSARKSLSYSEKIAKIGPVHLEIFDKIRRICNDVNTQRNFR